mmetsp:Transcript_7671/g.12421  ORF Transcript_7671/g.12421 Transcript_7671/m.12421 type:complete len:83 (+) Transcript_7671:65-313(+)
MSFSATRIAVSSAAKTVLQRRAIQCSFSSVFHIRNANGGAITEESKRAEKIFTRAVVWPLGAMVLLGGGTVAKRQIIGESGK